MSKYIDADKFYAKIVSGDPFLFDHAVENELKFMLEQEKGEDVIPSSILEEAIDGMAKMQNTYHGTEYETVVIGCMGELLNALKRSVKDEAER